MSIRPSVVRVRLGLVTAVPVCQSADVLTPGFWRISSAFGAPQGPCGLPAGPDTPVQCGLSQPFVAAMPTGAAGDGGFGGCGIIPGVEPFMHCFGQVFPLPQPIW